MAFTMYALPRRREQRLLPPQRRRLGLGRKVPRWIAAKIPKVWVKAYEKATHDKFNERVEQKGAWVVVPPSLL